MKVRSGRIRKPSAAKTRPSSPSDRGEHEHRRQAEPLLAVDIGQQHFGGAWPRDRRPAREDCVQALDFFRAGRPADRHVPRRGDAMPLPIENAEAVILVLAQPGPERGSQLGLLRRPKQCGRIPVAPCEEIADRLPDARIVGGDRGDGLVGSEQELQRLDIGVPQGEKLGGHLGPHDPFDRGMRPEPRDGEDRGGDQRPSPDPLPEESAGPRERAGSPARESIRPDAEAAGAGGETDA